MMKHRRYPHRRSPLAVLLTALLLLAGAWAPAHAQEAPDTSKVVPAPEARKSPMALTAMKMGDSTYVKVVYGAPRKRGRVIFGELVPYGKVWRTGANEATELTTTTDLRFGGQELPAGTYALFTIPGEDTWTVILNRALGQWGAFEHDPEMDVLRVEVPVEAAPKMYEAFTIDLEETGDGADLAMMWDNARVVVPLQPLDRM